MPNHRFNSDARCARADLPGRWEPVPIDEKACTRRGKAIIGLLAGIGMAAPMGAVLGPLGTLGGFLGGVAVSGATLVDLAVDSRWYLRTEFRATRRFSRGKLFHRFNGTAIAPAVEEFVRRAANQVQFPVSRAVFDHYGSRLRMNGRELHSALKT